MRKIVLIIIFFYTSTLKAQLFQEKKFYPNVKKIIGKYYNGSAGKGWWSFAKLDSLGRIVEFDSYRKKELLSRTLYRYNDMNDILFEIYNYDVNHPGKIDTLKNQYEYSEGHIIYEKSMFTNRYNDSNVSRLIKSQDSVFTYQYTSYVYRQNQKQFHTFNNTFILTYNKDNLLTKEERLTDSGKVTTCWDYYSNNELKRRSIERLPESKGIVYAGTPGSDDETYEYKYDDEGRVKTFYKIIDNKAYKIATYKYVK